MPPGNRRDVKAWSIPVRSSVRSTPEISPFFILKPPRPERDLIISAWLRPRPASVKPVPLSPEAIVKPAMAERKLFVFNRSNDISILSVGTALAVSKLTFNRPAPPYIKRFGMSAFKTPLLSLADIFDGPKDKRSVMILCELTVKDPFTDLKGSVLIGASLQG